MKKTILCALFVFLLFACTAFASARVIAANTSVTKFGQLPYSFTVAGQALPDGVTAEDFAITGEAVSWDNAHTYPFAVPASVLEGGADGWTLSVGDFPHRYYFVRKLDVTCEGHPELSFSMEDIDDVNTDVVDEFSLYEDYDHRVTAYVYRPASDEPLPVVLVLHGYGETEPLMASRMAVGWAEPKNQSARPSIVIAPFINSTFYTSETARTRIYEGLMQYIDQLIAEGAADPKRVYVTGNSFGGMASFELACLYPDRFAAVMALCPALNYSPRATIGLAGLADLPVTIAAAENDETIPSSVSVEAYEKLRAAGNERAQLRLYSDEEMNEAGAVHGYEQLYSFHHVELPVMEDITYAEWLFAQVSP